MAVNIGAELQALPLDFLISSPLVAAVNAQRYAAQTTLEFIEGLIDEDGKPKNASFSIENMVNGTATTAKVDAPILSLVPVPHLRIDQLTIHFTFNISQTVTKRRETTREGSFAAKSGAMLSPWVSAEIKGSMSSKSARDSTVNRSGELEVTVQASESPIPEGLARVLSMLASSIDIPVEVEPG